MTAILLRCFQRLIPSLRLPLLILTVIGLVAAWWMPVLVLAQGVVPTRNTPISLAVMPGQPDVVLAGTYNAPDVINIYRTTDGGLTWTGSGEGMLPNTSVAGVAVDPQNPNLVLAGDGGFGYMYRSQDGGVTWSELTGFKAMLAENAAVGELYAVVENTTTVFYASTRYEGVFRSPNGGDIWQKLDSGLAGEARRVREVLVYNGIIYAGTHAGLYRLQPGSSVWEFVPGLPNTTIVFSLWSMGDQIYAGTGQGLYVSADGETWSPVANFPQTIVYDLIDTGQRLVAATENGLWAGAGDVWQQPTVNGVPYSGVVYAVANTPEAPRTIYAATVTDWVLRSDDEGLTFFPISAMPPLDVQAALATPTPVPTPTPTPTDTPTPTATPTETPTLTPTPTATDTPVPTDTPIPTDTPLPTPTMTDTPLPTETATETTATEITQSGAISMAVPDADAGDPLSPSIPVSVPEAAAIPDEPAVVNVDLPTPAPPTDTPTPTAMPTDTPVPLEPTEVAMLPVDPTSTPTDTPTDLPAEEVSETPPTEPPTPAPTQPAPTPEPAATREPVDVAGLVYTSLPPVFVGAGVLLFFVIVAAGLSVIRGPRDI